MKGNKVNKKIAIASVLKPVDETRMYHKLGKSLAKAGFEVHIAGYKGHTTSDKINLYPFFSFRRISFQRLLAPFKIFSWLLKIKPDLLIITTHELLWMGVLYKSLFKIKLIYDIQENYYLNIRNTDAFPSSIRKSVAAWVRAMENLTTPFIDHFFLAESGYQEEIKFIKSRYTILENKALKPKEIPKGDRKGENTINLLFTGTLAESTGIFYCIQMAKKLHDHDKNVTFTIAGMCHVPEIFNKIKYKISKHNWIKLIGGLHPVDHNEILQQIKNCDAAFIYYPNLELVKNTMPTKLYEYLAYQTPILLQDYDKWLNLANKHNAAIPINPTKLNPHAIIEHLKNETFYPTTPGNEVLWQNEQVKLIKTTKSIVEL